MGKHANTKKKYTKTHQRSESELTRSLRGINISIFLLSAPKTEGGSHKSLTRCTRNTQIYVFSRVGFMEPPAPTIYMFIYIYICVYMCVHIFFGPMGAPWAGPLGLSPTPPRPPRPAPGPPLPLPGSICLRGAYASLRAAYAQDCALFPQRKEGNSHKRTTEGPGGGGAGAKGPGGPVSVEGNCIRVEYLIGQHIV